MPLTGRLVSADVAALEAEAPGVLAGEERGPAGGAGRVGVVAAQDDPGPGQRVIVYCHASCHVSCRYHLACRPMLVARESGLFQGTSLKPGNMFIVNVRTAFKCSHKHLRCHVMTKYANVFLVWPLLRWTL